MTEAWQTATELLQNAEMLEKMLDEQPTEMQPRGSFTAESLTQPGAASSARGSFDDLWRRQQLLWEKSQELHKEGSHFMQP